MAESVVNRIGGRGVTKNAGFSLLESMIALFLISIGMLGIAAMLLHNLKSATDSSWRAQAALFANEASERIKLHSAQETSGTCAGGYDAVPDYSIASCSVVTRPTTCTSDDQGLSCPTQEAWRDMGLYELCAKVNDPVRGGMPGGQLLIRKATRNCNLGGSPPLDSYQVEVRWNVRAASTSGDSVNRYETLVQP